MNAGPLPAYRARLRAGALRTDPAQAMAAERLQDLWTKLRNYDPPALAPQSSLVSRFFRRKTADDMPEGRANGLYLVGDVGRGKSMLMDLFFEQAQVPRKRRVHFHAFMQDVHRRLHEAKRSANGADPIPQLADALAAEAALLCFDEFQVNDIADAMILGRLFQALFDRQVIVVATSNTPPDRLFAGQPGRDAFLPFIALLLKHLDVLVLEGAEDYRREKLAGHASWHVPADAKADAALDAAMAALAGGPGKPDRLAVMGRSLAVPRAGGGVARFDFEELCGRPLGPGDYLALATHYHTLILDRVPRLGPEKRDEARRFITLIDALYDHRAKLIASAADVPDRLYERGEGAEAFRRTASRLEEMRSDEYLELAHLT